ncbi:hypothetical protein IKE88_02870 [Candidatus Saccharibacteria bacterium]|nr:hypothetical protein [Candidatus Saccharibacteria bacterium]
MGNPTDPNAGTNRINAVSRDNLMNEVSLGYDGSYGYYSLFNVGTNGIWWTSDIYNDSYSHYLGLFTDGRINPQDKYHKYTGYSVRCATQNEPEALIIATRLNQASIIHIQVVTTGATNYTR